MEELAAPPEPAPEPPVEVPAEAAAPTSAPPVEAPVEPVPEAPEAAEFPEAVAEAPQEVPPPVAPEPVPEPAAEPEVQAPPAPEPAPIEETLPQQAAEPTPLPDIPTRVREDIPPPKAVEWQTYQPRGLAARREEVERHLEKILALAHKKKTITNRDVVRHLYVSPATANRYLNKLVVRGQLKRSGRGRSVVYSV